MIIFLISVAAALAIYGFFAWIDAQVQEKRALASGICDVDKMSGKQFRNFLLIQFSKLGYHVNQNSNTQDYGADLILRKGSSKTVIQAKRWKNPVGVKAVQEVARAVKYYRANKGIVITNNRFTETAYDLARSKDVELWDRRKLIDLILLAQTAE